MKKKLVIFLSGAAAVAGFALVTGFGGMTKAQQMTAIEEKVTANLATLRETKTKECDDRVATAANTKAQEMLAAAPAQAGKGPSKPAGKPSKGKPKGGKVDPLPQPAPPPAKVDPQKERGGATTPETQKKREGTTAPGTQKKRGGAVKIEEKKEGGN